jgi:uncharacterized protein YutE (UPF0331/DUF86 family)
MINQDKINEHEIYQTALEKFGSNNQLIAAVEELAELQQVLCKFVIGKPVTADQIIDELVDVNIVLNQVQMIFHNNKMITEQNLSVRKMVKLIKLKQRIGL